MSSDPLRSETPQYEYEIPVTQFIRPHGRREETGYLHSDPVLNERARRIIDAGYNFEAEVLATGHVSLTIADRRIEEDLAIEICENGPPVCDAMQRLVDRMIMRMEKPS